jgi:hypothetical protein
MAVLVVRHQFASGVCPSLEKTLSEKLNITLKTDVSNPKLVFYIVYAIGARVGDNLDIVVRDIENKYKASVKVIVLRLGDREEMLPIAMPNTIDSVQIAFNGEGLAYTSMTKDAITRLKQWII